MVGIVLTVIVGAAVLVLLGLLLESLSSRRVLLENRAGAVTKTVTVQRIDPLGEDAYALEVEELPGRVFRINREIDGIDVGVGPWSTDDAERYQEDTKEVAELKPGDKVELNYSPEDDAVWGVSRKIENA